MLSEAGRDPLEDIRDNFARARRFAEGLDVDAFLLDDKSSFAVTHCLKIISETSRRLPAPFKQRYPEIPWKKIAGSGNKYRHGYEHVQERRFWATIHEAPPPLLAVLEAELDATPPDNAGQNFT